MAVAARHGERQAVRSRPRRTSVLVAGGGVAGLEALLARRDLAGKRVMLTLLAPDPVVRLPGRSQTSRVRVLLAHTSLTRPSARSGSMWLATEPAPR